MYIGNRVIETTTVRLDESCIRQIQSSARGLRGMNPGADEHRGVVDYRVMRTM
jgi:hypothetical protein